MKTTWRWTDERAANPRGSGTIGCRLLMMTASLGDSTLIIPTQLRMFGVSTKNLVEILQSVSRIVLPNNERGLSWKSDGMRFRGACAVLGSQLLKISLGVALRGLECQLACTRLVLVLLHGGLTNRVPIPAGLVELAGLSICLWLTLGIGVCLGCPHVACSRPQLYAIDRDTCWVLCQLDASGERPAIPICPELVPEPGGMASQANMGRLGSRC